MDRVPFAHKASICGDFLSAWAGASNGVTAKTASDRQKYWQHWATYATWCGVDPYLEHTPPLERDEVVKGFAARVRRGTYGRGAQIKVSGVTDALAAISKTIELAGKRSPLYRKEQAYQLSIERTIEGFRRCDAPSVPQLAVPVVVPRTCFLTGQKSTDQQVKTTGQLVIIAFYFL